MFFLRQGATHKVVIGPVVAVANGYVPVTTLSLSAADEAEVILHDNGTVVDISGYTFAAITTADGYYHLTLQSGISNTVGHMTVVINDDSLCLPVKADFTVLEEAVYDALYAASAPGYLQPATAGRQLVVDAAGLADANMVKMGPTGSGTAQTARDIGASVLLSSGTGTGQLKLASGYVAMTWADIAAPTTAVALTGTTIATTQKVDVETIKTNAVVNGGTVTFPTNATLASTTNITAGTIATVTTLTNLPAITSNWLTAAGLATDAVNEIVDQVWREAIADHSGTAGSTAEALSAAGGAGDPWITALPGSYTSGQAGYILGTNLDAAISTRSTYAGADTSGTTTLLSRLSSTRAGYLDNLSGGAVALASTILDAAGIRSALGLASANLDTQLGDMPTANENADALLGRNVAGGSSTGRTVSQALYFLRNKWTISGGTLTVYATDDTTSSWTASITQTAGDPVSASDPA